jgi:elongation factor P
MIDNPGLLKEGFIVEISFHAETETPLTLEMPPFVELEITYTSQVKKVTLQNLPH